MAHTATDPILVEDEVDPFIDEWETNLTGQEILALKKRTTTFASEALFLSDPIQNMPIVDAHNIFSLDAIPSQGDVKKADELRLALKDPCNRNKGYLVFMNLQVTCGGFRLLQLKHTIINFARNLGFMLDWLDQVAKHDKAWEPFRNVLCDTTGILTHIFKPHHSVSHAIDPLFSFIGERWLTGEAVDATLDMFSVQYSLVGGFVFLPTNIPFYWETGRDDHAWTYGRDRIHELMERARRNLTAKAFTVMNTGDHWAPLCIDFTQKSILFGDSLDDGRQRLDREGLGHVQRWLSSCDVNIVSWNITEDKIQRLDVPLQPRGRSGSCGVIALNSIERGIDPSVERWSHEKSAYHRLRYLALLTRPFEEPLTRPFEALKIHDTQDKSSKTSLQAQATQMQDVRDKEDIPLPANSQMGADQTGREKDVAKGHCGQVEDYEDYDQISVRPCNKHESFLPNQKLT
ncbi:hypothetical protein BGZ65_005870 [Modicella reniformis]|uniref:Uncharacterized protein n=1 Tax=Modicella reniformis TaxID=1440133 RepID=A0A9P6IKG7_9FUNG|nr:hypothetical protein BGZ65_005870 [Modicella reniformis]